MWAIFVSVALSVPQFRDVPADHWARDSVKAVAELGFMKGYPDEFRGDKPVTRYEFAVALDRFVTTVEKGLKEGAKNPVAKKTSVGAPPTHWAYPSLIHLLQGGYLPEDSPIFSSGMDSLKPDEIGKAFGQIAARITDLFSDPTEPHD
jgi:hypothetical protein